MSRLEQFLEEIGLPSGEGETRDWGLIEANLGTPLPTDYKSIVENLPDGVFRSSIRLVRPEGNDYLGYFRHRLDDMRRWRHDEPERFPFPIFPE